MNTKGGEIQPSSKKYALLVIKEVFNLGPMMPG